MAKRQVESICVLKATHNGGRLLPRRRKVESICVLKATHNFALINNFLRRVESICVLKATHNPGDPMPHAKPLKVSVF